MVMSHPDFVCRFVETRYSFGDASHSETGFLNFLLFNPLFSDLLFLNFHVTTS
jgi:hypothetical protein